MTSCPPADCEDKMITSSGAKCDVCGKYILPIDPDERVNEFGIKGIAQTLHCDNTCKQKLIDAGKDWKKLPDGPLRKVFEENENKINEAEEEYDCPIHGKLGGIDECPRC